MRLTDLDARFLAIEAPDVWRCEGVTFEQAQGISFLCPKCYAANGGPVGTHSVICWSRSRGVPDEQNPCPGRWLMVGTSFHDLTLNADPPSDARSIQLRGGCEWHGYVTSGEAA